MNPRLLEILQHSLGVNRFGRGDQYRNHFVAGEADVGHCRELVALGFMWESAASVLTGGMPLFKVTDAGKVAMASNSPSPPKLTRGARRYLDWLNADTGRSFAEYIGVAKN